MEWGAKLGSAQAVSEAKFRCLALRTDRKPGKKHIVSKKHKPGDQHLNLSKSAEEKAKTDRRHRKMVENLQKV